MTDRYGSDFGAIRTVLGAYRSTDAHITEEQITAAWAEHERARRYRAALEEIATATGGADDPEWSGAGAMSVAQRALDDRECGMRGVPKDGWSHD